MRDGIKLSQLERARFCEVMKNKCEVRGITIDQLADIIDVSPRSIYNFISVKTSNPSKFLALKIANELGINEESYKANYKLSQGERGNI